MCLICYDFDSTLNKECKFKMQISMNKSEIVFVIFEATIEISHPV